MGSNSNNQLVYDTQPYNIKTPLLVTLDIDVAHIYCGYEHVIYETYNGDFYGAGKNQFGELGLGSKQTYISEGNASFSSSLESETRKTYSYLTLLTVNTDDVLDLVCGNMCTAFIKKGYILVNYNFFLEKLIDGEVVNDNVVKHEGTGLNLIFFKLSSDDKKNFLTYEMKPGM